MSEQRVFGSTIKSIQFDGQVVSYIKRNGLVSYFDDPNDFPSMTKLGNKGITYALLDDSGDVVGEVSDYEQDGYPDLRIWNKNSVLEIWHNNGWFEVEKDSNGQFIIVGLSKIYIERDSNLESYKVKK